MPILSRAYNGLAVAGGWLQSPLLLVMRLYWGWQFHVTGTGKQAHLHRTAEFFRGLRIPFPTVNACIAGATECVGGLLLLLGLASRLVSVPLMFVMIVAYLTADFDKVRHIFTEPDKFVTADPFLFLLTAVVVFAFGPGIFSIDWLIARKAKAPSASAKR
jgi:putative oxidoreductase